jgi:hypothetical protein
LNVGGLKFKTSLAKVSKTLSQSKLATGYTPVMPATWKEQEGLWSMAKATLSEKRIKAKGGYGSSGRALAWQAIPTTKKKKKNTVISIVISWRFELKALTLTSRSTEIFFCPFKEHVPTPLFPCHIH